jgi:hypothetical protein
MTRKIFTLLLFVAAFVMTQAQVKMEIPKATKAPVVDGYLDDVDDPWGTLVDMTVRNPGGTTTGMTSKFKLLAGADAFYVAVVVEDATPSNDATAIPNSYERDCSEIFFSIDTVSMPVGAYKTGCWQVRIQREGETLIDGNSGANTWAVTTLTGDPNFKYAAETSATEWIAELIFPYATLAAGLDPAWDYGFTRFDIATADNTTGAAGGRTEQRYWYGHNGLGDDHGWDNTQAMAICKMPKLDAVTTLNNVKASAFVSNNVLNVKNVNGVVGIYNIKGSLVRTATVNGNGSIAIADLQSGMYIVKSNELSMKFVK